MTEEQAQQIANFRYGMIAEVVVHKLERGEQAGIFKRLAAGTYKIPFSDKTRVDKRTLERWLGLYRRGGLEALKPTGRTDRGSARALTPQVLGRAEALKKELPARSVPQIIAMLELAGEVQHGQIKPSTLRRHLAALGVKVPSKERRLRRFGSPCRNHTWQGDCHHTLYLPDPMGGERKKQAYLLAFIDDYSRFVPHGEYYFEERRPKLEDALKKAVLKYGVPVRLYCDNGAIYSGPHLERIAGELGFQLIHSRPGKPEGRGKVEKFFQFVDRSFKPEAYELITRGKLTSIEQLNEYFWSWLEVSYHQRPHGAFKQTPRLRFESDLTPLKRLDPFRLRQSFLWQEERRVDKTGCISLEGNIYEVNASLSRRTVTVRYDPYSLDLIQVWHGKEQYPDAQPINLQRTRHRDLGQPAPVPAPVSTGLNLLELTKRQHEEDKKKALGEMRFPRLTEEAKK